MLNLERIKNLSEEYCFAEIGCYKGNTSSVISNYLPPKGTFFICDTFAGFEQSSINKFDKTSYKTISSAFKDTSMGLVKEKLYNKNQCELIKGYFPKSATDKMKDSTYAFALIDLIYMSP